MSDVPTQSLWKNPLLRAALIIFATLIAYWPATRAGYIWDDDVYVTENPLLDAPDGLKRIWFSLDSPSQYFPLVYTTFRAEYTLWGTNPAGYHWVNILLHIANALLVWRLLERLKVPGAWLAASIFALHPVHVESVAWITERKNVLSVFFFLLTLLAWDEFMSSTARRKWISYAFALVCCALALFAKTTACTLPAALLLILWLKREPITWRRFAQVGPFVALGIGMGLLTVWWERYHQGTQGKLFAMNLPERTLVAGHAVWFYIGKLFWPVDLTFSYPHWELHPWNPLAYGWILLGLAACWAIYCAREDIGRSGEVAAVFFVATLSPMLGFIMLYTFRYSFVADHYQYAASIGPIALVSAGIATLSRSREKYRTAIHVCAVLIVATLGVLTWRQCHIYRNSQTIWRDTIAKNPSSLMAHYNLGNDLMRAGHLDESLDHYNRAIELDPTFIEARCNRGDIYSALGKNDLALADYTDALKIDPSSAIVQNSCGVLLKKMGRNAEAAAHFSEAVKIQPHYSIARKNLAEALMAQGDVSGAQQHYEAISRDMPNSMQAHLIAGRASFALGKSADSIREFREVLRIDPGSVEAMTRLSWVLATTGDSKLRNAPEAIQLASKACELTQNNNPLALNSLAAAYAADGRFVDAVSTGLSALDLASQKGETALAKGIRDQLQHYQGGHALYEKSP